MFLIAMSLTLILLALSVLETILYLAYATWYYRFGPPLIMHRWQASAGAEAMVDAVDEARRSLKLGSRRRGHLFLLRFRWWDLSVWSRLTLRVDQSEHGAQVTYEVRPFMTPALLGLSVLLFAVSGRGLIMPVGYFLLIVVFYGVGMVWELRRLKTLKPLRDSLQALGLSVCAKCGYDRFGLEPGAVCPECGGSST